MWKSLGCSLLVLCAGCAGSRDGGDESSSEDALSGSDPRPFVVSDGLGRKAVSFWTPSGVTEFCVIPKHFQEDGYADKDSKKEDKLCAVDFNGAVGDASTTPGALLPKDNSTNPAVDVYEVTAALSRDAIETQAQANAGDNRKADKLGRFKSSLDESRFGKTTSYGPSIVGYYGTSRFLGNIAEVTPAVWRTMAVSRHAGVAQLGANLSSSASRIVKTQWAAFITADGAPRGNLTYTPDGKQVYGAFIPKVSGDAKDTTIDTLDRLTSSARFAKLTSARELGVGRDLGAAATTIIPLQGITEMLVLDALMLQGDRLSGDNVSYIPYVYFQKPDGSIDKVTQKDFDKDHSIAPNGVPVKKLYLNDVDAGLVDHSSTSYRNGSEFKLLTRISHISPDLYVRALNLAMAVTDPRFESYVKTEWRFTDNDFAKYKIMAGVVGDLLKDRCKSGQLLLDLDVQKYMTSSTLPAGQGCE